ncbi:MAG: valine--tRNA ligase [Pirellulaceae bacterium]|nr:valine--tRNA ligase [Pirellulaceae bacterium]
MTQDMTSFSPESLPNRFEFAEAQARLYAEWEARGFFHAEPPKAGEQDKTKGPYCIVIPPPNVTGALHLGHALNNTLQDIQIRMHRMQGYNTLWMPGTDHAGIATQAVVEKRLREEEGKTRHDLGREGLIERIWQWKEVYEKRILTQLKQMGCSCDWDRTRFTFDEGCSRAVRQTFFSLFSQGLIYRGKRLVNWDTFLQTAVSDDEVFQETVKGKFWHFKYPVIPATQARSASEGSPSAEPTHVEIATTRPETMLGDTAVAVHPDPARALDRAEAELRERLDKAPAKEKDGIQAQLDNIGKRRTEMLPLLVTLRELAKAGRKLMLPLVNREIPLVCDEWAKPELGTGAVKITPAHDPNDYEVGKRQSLPMINILNPDGTLNDAAGPYKGLTIYKARDKVVADLDKLGLLGDVEDREIELPHSDRSKTPIEPYLADQWFVKMGDVEGARDSGLGAGEASTQARSASEGTNTQARSASEGEGVAGVELASPQPGLAQMAMDAVSDGRVQIFPERYAKSYLDWLGEKRDWPVSRQLWWGHRIPVWSKDTGAEFVPGTPDDVFCAMPVSSRGSSIPTDFVQVRGERGSETGTFRVLYCVAPGHEEYERDLEAQGFTQDPDVLDTWFSSALWPHSTLGWPEQTDSLQYWYPTSTLITSRDIITLWVARMVLTGLNNMQEIPFREVFIHPKILDGYGVTMSKSKGNGVDPLDIVDKFGADSLRFGLAMLTTETQDVRMPVQFECPHCQALIDQTKKNRELPKIACAKCGKEFSTQWAKTEADKALPRAAVVSERFEVARNFMNKLWNAARFALLNLADGTQARSASEGSEQVQSSKFKVQGSESGNFEPGTLNPELTTEDRWLLSRLATVTESVTEGLRHYHYSEAAKTLYDFAWDEFCSFYVEIAKARLADENSRPTAQRVLAHALDTLLRLLHPIMPFITEEVWQLLNKVAPERGLEKPTKAPEWLITAPWPAADLRWQDQETEARFAVFQKALAAIREIRSRQNIAGKNPLEFCIKCDAGTAALLQPMTAYFQSMANATATGFGPDVATPATSAKTALAGMEIFVDLAGFIDVGAELAKNQQLEQKLLSMITGKQGKLSNESFVARAPANVVQAERDSLAQMQEQLASVRAALAALKK